MHGIKTRKHIDKAAGGLRDAILKTILHRTFFATSEINIDKAAGGLRDAILKAILHRAFLGSR